MHTHENPELLAKYLAGECTESEQQQVTNWLQSDKRNQQYYEQLKQVWEQSVEDYSEALPNSQALWQRLQAGVRKDQPFLHVQKEDRSQQVRWQWAGRIAASVLLVLGLVLTAYYYWSRQTPTVTQLTQSREKKELILPDGTKVWLNEGSTLSYPKVFAEDQRKVTLEGEAYFEVVHLEHHQPFIIATGETETTVLGTSFNVDAYPARGVQVTVLTGKVAFAGLDQATKRVVLTKGFTGIYNSTTKQVQKLATEDLNFLAWKTGVLTFKDTPLKKVVEDLTDYYQQKIIVQEPSLSNCRFTGTFNKQPIEKVLQTISLTFDASVIAEDSLVTIQEGGCQ